MSHPTATSTLSELLIANESYSSLYTRDPNLVLPSKKSYAIITCMDPRIDIPAALGIELGDAPIIRNAGGSARVAMSDAAVAGMLGGPREIIIVKHTDCGMTRFHGKDINAIARAKMGEAAANAIAEMRLASWADSDVDAVTVEDVEFLRKSPVVTKNTTVSGLVFDMETGKVKQVA